MTVNDVFKWIDAFAPFDTQDEYDNAGLLVGDPSVAVHGILFALDATMPVAKEAVKNGAELIITHHPLMFKPVQQLRYDQGEGAVLRTLAEAGISLIAAHTNLDICPGGVADTLADLLALTEITGSDKTPYMRTGMLPAPCTAGDLAAQVDHNLSACTRLYGDPDAIIRSVAVVPGAGGGEGIYVKADAFVTGEVAHHELLDLAARGVAVFDAGHYPTEFPGIAALYRRFQRADADNGWNVQARLYEQQPFPCVMRGSSAPRGATV